MYNLKTPEVEWIALNFPQLLTSRQLNFSIIKTNRCKVGNNILANRLYVLNNKIKLTDLNESITSFKINHEKIFLSNKNILKLSQCGRSCISPKPPCSYEILNMILHRTF